jgi:hypothetical protein
LTVASDVEAALNRGNLMGVRPFSKACESLIAETCGAVQQLLFRPARQPYKYPPYCSASSRGRGDHALIHLRFHGQRRRAQGRFTGLLAIDPVTFNLDPDAVASALTGRTRAVYAVEDVSERLDIVPAHLRVLVIRRPKYACRACEDGVVQAPAPARLIEGGVPTDATVAHVLVAKYADHLPVEQETKTKISKIPDSPADRTVWHNWSLSSGYLLSIRLAPNLHKEEPFWSSSFA